MARALSAPRPGEVILPGQAPEPTAAVVEELEDPISFAGELMELVDEEDEEDAVTEVAELPKLRKASPA